MNKKPPLGIIPLWLHNEQRLDEINSAITRYSEANLPIPLSWVTEYYTLSTFFKNRSEEKTLNPTNTLEEGKSKDDWEILSYIDPTMFSDIKDANIVTQGSPTWNIAVLRNYPIESVLRKSDGEVFSIGDNIKGVTVSNVIIKGFNIQDGILTVEQTSGDCNLWDISKLPSTTNSKEEVKPFVWTDELVMEVVGKAHRDGYNEQTLGLFDRVQNFKKSKLNQQ
jgi:hypothetical protein